MNFFAIFFSGDIILNLVFIVLLSMSFLSWYIIFYKAIKLRKEYVHYKAFCRNNTSNIDWARKINKLLIENGDLSFDNLKKKSPFKNSLNYLLNEIKKLQPVLKDYNDRSQKKEILTMHLIQALDEIRFGLDKGLTILASIGSCAPFVGLFGTVWGIYHALGNIAKQGNAGLNIVAGPISEALVATAFGLFSAIPAVLAYNSFVRFNRLLVQNLRHFAEQITTYNNSDSE